MILDGLHPEVCVGKPSVTQKGEKHKNKLAAFWFFTLLSVININHCPLFYISDKCFALVCLEISTILQINRSLKGGEENRRIDRVKTCRPIRKQK